MIAALLAAALLQQAAAPYTADGSEPFWSLEITDGRMVYRRDGEPLSVALPPRRATANGYRYETRELIVDIKHEECTDEAATIRAESVTVIVDDLTVHGCGGEVLGTEDDADSE